MAQRRQAAEPSPVDLDPIDDGDASDTAAPQPVAIDDDLTRAVRRAAAAQRRVLVRDGEEEIAAIIPIADLRLLRRLEEEELDRIDLAQSDRALADPDNYPTIPWEHVKREAGL